jgi:EpsI family protein
MTPGLRARLLLVVVILLAARLATAERHPVATPLAQPLASFPLALDEWYGYAGAPLDPETLRILGADDHLNRIYEHADLGPAGLFVAYYGSQQHGDAIHSPQNCLPGSGWVPVSRSRTSLDLSGRHVPINRYIVQNRGDRQLVLYWFQGRGRVVASEYLNKAYLFGDALTRGRSDGSLVRIIVPILGDEAAADRAALEFTRRLLPTLDWWLP